jgi:hypothetical protein
VSPPTASAAAPLATGEPKPSQNPMYLDYIENPFVFNPSVKPCRCNRVRPGGNPKACHTGGGIPGTSAFTQTFLDSPLLSFLKKIPSFLS